MPRRAGSGGGVPVRLKRNAQARRLSIRVSAEDGVVVVAPVRMGRTAIAAALDRRRGWILRTLEQVRAVDTAKELPREVRLFGAGYRVERCGSQGGCGHTVGAEASGDLLTVCPPPGADAHAVLRAWCADAARARLPALVREAASAGGFTAGKIVVRDQRTRWGSCSRSGTISLNWRIALLPPEVMRYLIVHELAHTRVMDHGPEFWDVVASACPEYRAAETWLRRNGRRLPL